MIGIYKITSPSNKIYIGQSIRILDRWKDYKRLYKGLQNQIQIFNSLKKYGHENHKFEIICECEVEELDQLETLYKKFYMNMLGWDKMLFCELYDGGGGPRSQKTKNKISKNRKGILHSEESKLKMSKSHKGLKLSQETKDKMSKNSMGIGKGKNLSQETKDKISKANKGNKFSDESKQKISKSKTGHSCFKNPERGRKISESNKGRKLSQETKNKISSNNKGISRNKKSVLQYDLEGNFIRKWDSGLEAMKHYSGDIYSCCQGRQQTAGGYIWLYE